MVPGVWCSTADILTTRLHAEQIDKNTVQHLLGLLCSVGLSETSRPCLFASGEITVVSIRRALNHLHYDFLIRFIFFNYGFVSIKSKEKGEVAELGKFHSNVTIESTFSY